MPHAPNGLWWEEAGSGEPVVLLHQGVVDSRIWARVVPLLADDFRVVGYDQRGYGRSAPWAGPYSLVDDLLGVLDAAGIARAALVGASRGGRIALSTALLAPDRVSALVLVGSGLPGHRMVIEGTEEQEARWEAAAQRGDSADLAELDMEFWAPLGADAELRTLFLENAEASNGEDPAAAEPEVKARLDEIAVPTLVVTGADDVPAINEVGELLANGIAGTRTAIVDRADHMIQWRAPEELSRLVRELLAA